MAAVASGESSRDPDDAQLEHASWIGRLLLRRRNRRARSISKCESSSKSGGVPWLPPLTGSLRRDRLLSWSTFWGRATPKMLLQERKIDMS